MELTNRELKLIERENSYRAERTGCAAFAVLFGLPFAFLVFVAAKCWLDAFPDNQHIFSEVWGDYDFSRLYGSALLFMVLLFLAYRAQSKLTLIKHLKHHMSEPDNEMKISEQDKCSVRGIPRR